MILHTSRELLRDVAGQVNGFAKLVLFTSLFACLVLLLAKGGSFFNDHLFGISSSESFPDYRSVTVSPSADMEVLLKRHNLWDIEENSLIDPVVFTRYPLSLSKLENSERKRVFLHTLLPAAMIAQQEVRVERQHLLNAIDQIPGTAYEIDFDADEPGWQANFSREQVNRLLEISSKYQEVNADQLLLKVNDIPISLILAQAAIESAWGRSRFALQGNNLFGIWTWGDNGIVPKERAVGAQHKVAVFVSILESVRTYVLLLNRLPAYQTFREIRRHTSDPLELIDGLNSYSSRREKYMLDVKRMILSNNLNLYDTLTFM